LANANTSASGRSFIFPNFSNNVYRPDWVNAPIVDWAAIPDSMPQVIAVIDDPENPPSTVFTYTLDIAISASAIVVIKNGTRLTAPGDFTITGDQITFAVAPLLTDVIKCYFSQATYDPVVAAAYGSLVIRLNDTIINSPLQFTPVYGDWYSIVVNFSNVYKQISANVWEMSYDPVNPNEQTSKLNKVHEVVRMFTDPILFNAPSVINNDTASPFYGTDDNSYKIFTGPIFLTNIRLFKNMIDIDTQSTVLNQNVVRDAQLAHIIDNAKPLLKAPKFARNR
jgi:hypothetical protein